jgi:hypothetical protein
MSEWGRKRYKVWPSRRPVWTLAAFFGAIFCFVLMMAQSVRHWSCLERFYLPVLAKSRVCGLFPNAATRFFLLDGIDRTGQKRLALAGEVEDYFYAEGQRGYVLTEEARQHGLVRLVWDEGPFNDRALSRYLAHWIYQDQTVWDYIRRPAEGAAAIFVLLLFLTVPKDRERVLIRKHGRRLRGPELVTTAEFNARHAADGMAFIKQERSAASRVFARTASQWVRLPREREAMHFLVMGDSGMGKSAAIRQLLTQIWERGETAIVYDPTMEYLPQFYCPERGDVILNPVDARCPFWSPGEEAPHEAEALTLAASLFPDQGGENRFFVEAPRRIFAHLLNLHPTPEQAHPVDASR